MSASSNSTAVGTEVVWEKSAGSYRTTQTLLLVAWQKLSQITMRVLCASWPTSMFL